MNKKYGLAVLPPVFLNSESCQLSAAQVRPHAIKRERERERERERLTYVVGPFSGARVAPVAMVAIPWVLGTNAPYRRVVICRGFPSFIDMHGKKAFSTESHRK